jgi:hypothetical protein
MKKAKKSFAAKMRELLKQKYGGSQSDESFKREIEEKWEKLRDARKELISMFSSNAEINITTKFDEALFRYGKTKVHGCNKIHINPFSWFIYENNTVVFSLKGFRTTSKGNEIIPDSSPVIRFGPTLMILHEYWGHYIREKSNENDIVNHINELIKHHPGIAERGDYITEYHGSTNTRVLKNKDIHLTEPDKEDLEKGKKIKTWSNIKRKNKFWR